MALDVEGLGHLIRVERRRRGRGDRLRTSTDPGGVVVAVDLRREVRWDASVGGGRSSVWIHPGCNLVFKYAGGKVPELNRHLIEALAFTANAPSGLYLVREPETAAPERAAEHS
ncbi:hypothetical protein J3D45_002608 [Microbacterium foliorum]|uniref:DUF7882 family protein n=1 Tax=Microbacterium foliorum TaxID=104336 RepID=UPI00209DB145|nr:hypothetical protein [Microbacterium foliorum]MCP1430110.1 hypothetical protein [Microbacterium foliorum]